MSGPPLLSPPQIAFLRTLVRERPAARRSPGLAGLLSRICKIGATGTDSAFVCYRDEDFARATQVIEKSIAHSSVHPHKIAAESHRRATPSREPVIAAKPLGMGYMMPAGSFITLPVDSGLGMRYDVLLVCEKLEILARLEQLSWLGPFIAGRATLAVFGGAQRGLYRADTVRHLLDRSAAPLLSLHDFDPDGLHKASQLPRLEALCFPAWAQLEQLSQSRPFDPVFRRRCRSLGGALGTTGCSQVSGAWARMAGLAAGVPVEEFPG